MRDKKHFPGTFPTVIPTRISTFRSLKFPPQCREKTWRRILLHYLNRQQVVDHILRWVVGMPCQLSRKLTRLVVSVHDIRPRFVFTWYLSADTKNRKEITNQFLEQTGHVVEQSSEGQTSTTVEAGSATHASTIRGIMDVLGVVAEIHPAIKGDFLLCKLLLVSDVPKLLSSPSRVPISSSVQGQRTINGSLSWTIK